LTAFIDSFIPALVTLLVVIDPPGCAPVFASLTRAMPAQQRRSQAVRAVLVAGLILAGFAAVGQPFLAALGISLDAFRIAGGIMLFGIAIDMVFESRSRRRSARANEVARTDVAIFPMAMPMIAGPGSIASVMLLTSHAAGGVALAGVYAALLLCLLLTLGLLLAAVPLMDRLNPQVEAVLSRLLGVILAALAAQIVIDGIKGAF
jgi:multiple antibiotic resistance protein